MYKALIMNFKEHDKMVKQIIYTLSFTIVLLALSGCEKLLDLEPETSLTNETMWKNPEDFEKAANAFYGYLPQFFDILNQDKYADIFTGTSRDDISNSSYIVPVSSEFYTERYEEIRIVNRLFENAESYEGLESIDAYLGEAYFFRAYFHLRLFKKYGPLIYVKKVTDVDSPQLYSKRDERDDFVNNIIADLELAISSLQDLSEQSDDEIGRINKEAAQALLADVSLFEGTWQKYHFNNSARSNELLNLAVLNSQDIIDKGEYELFYSEALGDSSYRYLFNLENVMSNPSGITKEANKEYIFRNRFNENVRWINQNVNHTANSGHFSPTLKMVNMFLCDDGLPIDISPNFDRETAYNTFDGIYPGRDPRMTQSLRVPTRLYWNHTNARVDWQGGEEDFATSGIANPSIPSYTSTGYLNLKFIAERETPVNQESYDLPLIRLAEVYLIYAEAVYELNGTISDADLDYSINKVRSRVAMPPLSNSLVGDNGLDMLEEIRRERTVELYMEGKRYDDLRRWKTAENEMSENMLGVKIEGDYASPIKVIAVPGKPPVMYRAPDTNERLDENNFYIIETSAERQFQQRHYLWPIPSDQIALNPNLEQNPGWN